MQNEPENKPVVGDDGELLTDDPTVDVEVYYAYIEDPSPVPLPRWSGWNMLLTACIVLVGFVMLSTIIEQSDKAAQTKDRQTQDDESNQPLGQPLVSTISKVLDDDEVVPSLTPQPSPTRFYATSVPSSLKLRMIVLARTMPTERQ